MIGGNLCQEGDRRGVVWAREMRAAILARPDIGKPIWQVSLRCAPGDRTLSDAEWADASQLFAERMGFAEHPWVVVRHADDHVHIVVSRVSDAGLVWHARNDYREVQSARRELEERYGLTQAATTTSERSRRTPDHQTKRGERARGIRESVTPARVLLAARVRAAVDAAAGAGIDRFEEALAHVGVIFKRAQASTGRISGYSFTHEQSVDEQKKPLWFKSSQLDRELAWTKIKPRLDDPGEAPVAVSVTPKRLLESAGTFKLRETAAHEHALRELFQRRLGQMQGVIAQQLHEVGDWWEKTPIVSAEKTEHLKQRQAVRVAGAGFARPATAAIQGQQQPAKRLPAHDREGDQRAPEQGR